MSLLSPHRSSLSRHCWSGPHNHNRLRHPPSLSATGLVFVCHCYSCCPRHCPSWSAVTVLVLVRYVLVTVRPSPLSVLVTVRPGPLSLSVFVLVFCPYCPRLLSVLVLVSVLVCPLSLLIIAFSTVRITAHVHSLSASQHTRHCYCPCRCVTSFSRLSLSLFSHCLRPDHSLPYYFHLCLLHCPLSASHFTVLVVALSLSLSRCPRLQFSSVLVSFLRQLHCPRHSPIVLVISLCLCPCPSIVLVSLFLSSSLSVRVTFYCPRHS